MSHPLRPIAVPGSSRLLLLGGCACEKPCTDQDLCVAAPTYTVRASTPVATAGACASGRTCEPHGSHVEALRVLVTNGDGAPQAEAPDVRVLSGANVYAITPEGSATVLWFAPPGPCDGCVTMQVTVSVTGNCPYRIRLVPVLKRLNRDERAARSAGLRPAPKSGLRHRLEKRALGWRAWG